MKKGLVFFLILLTLFFCGKKKEPGEKEMEMPRWEDSEPDASLPETEWSRSVAVESVRAENLPEYATGLPVLMTDGMLAVLGRSGGLRVMPPQEGPSVIEETLRPDYVLKSFVQEEAGGIHSRYSLMRTDSNTTVWTADYSEDILRVDAVVQEASTAILDRIGRPADATTPPLLPPSEEARRIYLEGMAHFARGDRDETNAAIERFKIVIRMDSTFIPAYFRMAESYLEIVDNKWDRNMVWLTLARDASRKAASMDPGSAEAQALLGDIVLRYGDARQAGMIFKKALGINSSLDAAWGGLGTVLSGYGLYHQSLEAYEKALAIRPSSVEYGMRKALLLIGLKQYEKAEEQLATLSRYHPEHGALSLYTGLVQYYRGNMASAEKNIRKGLEFEDIRPLSHAFLGVLYAKTGKLDEALAEVELEVKPYTGTNASLSIATAAIYALLERKGLAMEWLEKAYSYGYSEYIWLMNDPNFDGLREDPRFSAFMEKLKETWESKRKSFPEG